MRTESQLILSTESGKQETGASHAPADAGRDLSLAEEAVIKSYIRYNQLARESALPLRSFIQELERKLIACSLLMHMGNQKKVASLLGIKPSTLCEKLHRTNFENMVLRFNNSGPGAAEFLIDFAGERS